MRRPSVLVFAGLDPSGGAGISADIEAIGAVGAHALPIITALTTQDNDRVFAVNPVDCALLGEQAQILTDKVVVSALKIGILGNKANAAAIAEVINSLRKKNPALPVVLDTVLASGQGDKLSADAPEEAVRMLIPLATVVMPNIPEANRLCGEELSRTQQAKKLLEAGAKNVLIKGGHGSDPHVKNVWVTHGERQTWVWERLNGSFHGSGCTLASAMAGLLAQGMTMQDSLHNAQIFTQKSLESAYAIAQGQLIPCRHKKKTNFFER